MSAEQEHKPDDPLKALQETLERRELMHAPGEMAEIPERLQELAEAQHAPVGSSTRPAPGGGGGGAILSTFGNLLSLREGARDIRHGDGLHGSLEMLSGGLGGASTALSLAATYGGTALLGTAGAATAAAAAPIVGAIGTVAGLEAAGDKRAAELGLYAPGADGHARGSFEAAFDASMHAGDVTRDAVSGLTGSRAAGDLTGAAAAGVSGVALEAGAAGGNLLLGMDAMGASSGLFGHDEHGHEMGAIQAVDHFGQRLGNGVDNMLGLDHDSMAGRIVGTGMRVATDAVAAPFLPSLVSADVLGAGVGAARGLWNFGRSMFSGD